jgi:hypothetical protein
MCRRQAGERLLPGRISPQCGLSRHPRPYSPEEPEPKPPELHLARPATLSASPAIQTFHSTSRTYRRHDSGRRPQFSPCSRPRPSADDVAAPDSATPIPSYAHGRVAHGPPAYGDSSVRHHDLYVPADINAGADSRSPPSTKPEAAALRRSRYARPRPSQPRTLPARGYAARPHGRCVLAGTGAAYPYGPSPAPHSSPSSTPGLGTVV